METEKKFAPEISDLILEIENVDFLTAGNFISKIHKIAKKIVDEKKLQNLKKFYEFNLNETKNFVAAIKNSDEEEMSDGIIFNLCTGGIARMSVRITDGNLEIEMVGDGAKNEKKKFAEFFGSKKFSTPIEFKQFAENPVLGNAGFFKKLIGKFWWKK